VKRLHAYISGIVQGVGFRYFTMRHARHYGIVGYVRNLFDGRVEVVAEGDENVLRDFLEVLKQGPPGAYVEDVEVYWEDPTGEFSRFEIRY